MELHPAVPITLAFIVAAVTCVLVYFEARRTGWLVVEDRE